MAATKAKAGNKAAGKAKAAKDEPKFGVHSEVGQLRKVMVCAPGTAMYYKARREQGLAVFTKTSDWIVFGVIVVAAVYSIYALATGAIVI